MSKNSMKIEDIDVSQYSDDDHHERVVQCTDTETGLNAIIAIHNRSLGPAVGGCRLRAYDSDSDAITDALRLSRGMTYKAAMADLPQGGGKSVINVPVNRKTPALMRAMGRFVDTFGGDYVTAEDSGTNVDDMREMSKETAHVTGTARKDFGDGLIIEGDPSPSTAYGVMKGIEAAVKFRLGVDSLEGIRVAVQGVGHVGYHLAVMLEEAGAHVFAADVSHERLNALTNRVNAMIVDARDIHRAQCDVFAPCAFGGVLTFDALSEIPAQIIAGAANNQLATDAAGHELFARGKLYAPDYVINAGGVIDLHYERLAGRGEQEYDRREVVSHLDRIGDTLTGIFEKSRKRSQPTHLVADELARSRFLDERQVDVA